MVRFFFLIDNILLWKKGEKLNYQIKTNQTIFRTACNYNEELSTTGIAKSKRKGKFSKWMRKIYVELRSFFLGRSRLMISKKPVYSYIKHLLDQRYIFNNTENTMIWGFYTNTHFPRDEVLSLVKKNDGLHIFYVILWANFVCHVKYMVSTEERKILRLALRWIWNCSILMRNMIEIHPTTNKIIAFNMRLEDGF